uniref:Uncharacterized protein n=1 Tax=Glossina pallidipes TaxID=7398 RepID=A0A1A9ZG07_GLOPL
MAVVGDFIATARVEGGSIICNPLIATAIATAIAIAIATEIQPTICLNLYRHTNEWHIWRLQGNMNVFDIYIFLQQLQLQAIANSAALYHKRYATVSEKTLLEMHSYYGAKRKRRELFFSCKPITPILGPTMGLNIEFQLNSTSEKYWLEKFKRGRMSCEQHHNSRPNEMMKVLHVAH